MKLWTHYRIYWIAFGVALGVQAIVYALPLAEAGEYGRAVAGCGIGIACLTGAAVAARSEGCE